jgi:hypothetical protein
MKVVIFIGPSLPKAQVQKLVPDALVLAPAEQGDLDFAARQLGAEVIAFIDGVHRNKLPNWHSEILSALENGTRILGAASMGALRAVECHPWGAEYFGEIANWYASGKIDGDDEVCLIHDDAPGYEARSVPLVNVRATLICCGFPQKRKREILEAAKSIFYPDRTWPRIFAASEIFVAEKVQIVANELDIKAADALHLCHRLAKLPPRPEPERPIENADYGYAGVFRANDAKVLHKGKVLRMHQIAGDDPYLFRLAGYRALALEFCKLVGITPREPATEEDELPFCDDTEEERIALANDERMIDRAREWLSSSRANFGDVPEINNFLKTQGLYEKRKDQICQAVT